MKLLNNYFKTTLLCAILLGCSFLLNAQKNHSFTFRPGPYIRVGAGYYADVNVGAGYMFPFRLSVGGEVTSWSLFCGFGGMADVRYRFLDKQFSPFVDAKVGFGLLGKNLNYENCYGPMYSAMGGLSWRWLELGVGAAYDHFYGFSPMVNLSYTFILTKK